MDDGRVAEFDTPLNLLGIEGGMFRTLVDQTGSSNATYLRSLAEQKNSNLYETNQQSS